MWHPRFANFKHAHAKIYLKHKDIIGMKFVLSMHVLLQIFHFDVDFHRIWRINTLTIKINVVELVYIFRYPIYHIPMGRTIKDLSTCFLTYHTLSSSFQGIHSLSQTPLSLVRSLLSWIPRKLCTRLMYLMPFNTIIVVALHACRYGPWRRHGGCSRKEAKGRGRNLTPSIWIGNLQDARECVGLRQLWQGPGKAGVAFECGRFMAKAAQGTAPWLQLLHWNSKGLKDAPKSFWKEGKFYREKPKWKWFWPLESSAFFLQWFWMYFGFLCSLVGSHGHCVCEDCSSSSSCPTPFIVRLF